MTRSLVLAGVVTIAASSLSCTLLHHGRNAPARLPTNSYVPPPPKHVEERSIDVPPPELEPTENLAQFRVVLPNPPFHDNNKRRVSRVKESVADTDAEPEPEAPKPELPPLEQILTAEQQQAYKAVIDRNLDRARHTVETLNTRKLNSEQVIYMNRIKELIQQADDARKNDLVRSKNLAERAGVLADDLIKSVP